MTSRVPNKDARIFVQEHEPFRGSNTFAEQRHLGGEEPAYIVFSYGYHWPLFIYTGGKWYENADRYSVSTSKHRNQLHPHCETELRDARDMEMIYQHGVVGWMRRTLSDS